MKLNIKNYRTLKNLTMCLEDNKINYLIGSNESGKSSIMDAFRILSKNDKKIKIEQKDATVINSVAQKLDDIEFRFSYDKNENLIDSSRTQVWLSNELNYYNDYKIFIESNKQLLSDCKSSLSVTLANESLPKNKALLKGLLSIIDKLINANLISKEEIAFLNKEEVKARKEINQPFTKLLTEFYKGIELPLPYVIYIQPMENAFKREKIEYDWVEIYETDSLIRKMVESFADDRLKEELNDILKSQGQDDNQKRRKQSLIKNLNSQIATYFDKELPLLKGCPEFMIEGSKLTLNIIKNSTNNFQLDSGDENSRSLGFKSFVRIIFEIKMLSKSHEKILYMIDEPEQGLHPYLQELLIKEIRKLVDESKNITILLSSHSPYIVQLHDVDDFSKRLHFVLRASNSSETITSGETYVKKLSDQDFSNEMLEKWAESFKEGKIGQPLSEELFLFRMVLDSQMLNNFNKVVKVKVKELHRRLSNNEIDNKEFAKQLSEIQKLSNFFK